MTDWKKVLAFVLRHQAFIARIALSLSLSLSLFPHLLQMDTTNNRILENIRWLP
jgi:hypothetical protein